MDATDDLELTGDENPVVQPPLDEAATTELHEEDGEDGSPLPPPPMLQDSRERGRFDQVYCCDWSRETGLIATGSSTGSIALRPWPVTTHQISLNLRRESTARPDAVIYCKFSPDGKMLVAAYDNQLNLWVWCTTTGRCLRIFLDLGPSVALYRCCAFSPDHSSIVTKLGGNLEWWNIESGGRTKVLHDPNAELILCFEFSRNGKHYATGSRHGVVKMWTARDDALVHTLQGHGSCVSQCVFSPDSTRMLTASFDWSAKMWDVPTGSCLGVFRDQAEVSCCTFSPDGSLIGTTTYDGRVKIWGAHSAHCLDVWQGHAHGISCCAFSPDGSSMITGSCDNVARIWGVPYDVRRKILVVVVKDNMGRRRLPPELWEWMFDEGFFHYGIRDGVTQ